MTSLFGKKIEFELNIPISAWRACPRIALFNVETLPPPGDRGRLPLSNVFDTFQFINVWSYNSLRYLIIGY